MLQKLFEDLEGIESGYSRYKVLSEFIGKLPVDTSTQVDVAMLTTASAVVSRVAVSELRAKLRLQLAELAIRQDAGDQARNWLMLALADAIKVLNTRGAVESKLVLRTAQLTERVSGNLDKAVRLRLIDEQLRLFGTLVDPELQAAFLIALAHTLSSPIADQAASALLGRISDRIEQISTPRRKDEVHLALALALAGHGRWDRVRDSASQIGARDLRIRAFAGILTQYGRPFYRRME